VYEQGYGTEKDIILAVHWYKKAIDLNHTEANFNLGCIWFRDGGVERNYTKVFKHFKFAAEQGYDVAQRHLGIMYSQGFGTERDPISSIYWYKKALAQNNENPDAVYNLGFIYFKGELGEKDYCKAADLGFDKAQYMLGTIYENGYGTGIDVLKAIHWYEKVADQNHIEASNKLGDIYLWGEIVEKDYNKAFKYNEIAASKGNISSQILLGFCYFNGYGCDKGEDKGMGLIEELSGDGDMALAVLSG
jgi:TPR repeat protein